MNVIRLSVEEEESPVYSIGSRSKREWRAPADFAEPCSEPGIWYIFKWATKPHQQQQLWSEVIASEIGKLLGLDVPPCFPAILIVKSSENGGIKEKKSGVLMKRSFQEGERLEHAFELMQGANMLDDEHEGRPHFIERNLSLIREIFGETGQDNFSLEWWAKTLFFDALIGNGDRHPQNWGFVFGENNQLRMAGLYDNGNALMYQYGDEKLTPDLIEKSVERGHHHCTWETYDKKERYTHMKLCQKMAENYPGLQSVMLELSDNFEDNIKKLDIFLQDCVKCEDIDIRFTQKRTDFVKAFLRRRNICLRESLGGGKNV